MEAYLPISFLNDFIFCPRSIYFHQLYGKVERGYYQSKVQVAGETAHKNIDQQKYSTSKHILQAIEVYSAEYKLCGKIDLFDVSKQLLVERKKKIKTIYDGYIFQLYAQYFCLKEMGYVIQRLALHSLDDNKRYPIKLPVDDQVMFGKFRQLIAKMAEFDLTEPFEPNPNKCNYCIYKNLCDVSLATDY